MFYFILMVFNWLFLSFPCLILVTIDMCVCVCGSNTFLSRTGSKEEVCEEAVFLWKSMQVEGLTPSSTFLSTLTTLLQNFDVQVPFQTQ